MAKSGGTVFVSRSAVRASVKTQSVGYTYGGAQVDISGYFYCGPSVHFGHNPSKGSKR